MTISQLFSWQREFQKKNLCLFSQNSKDFFEKFVIFSHKDMIFMTVTRTVFPNLNQSALIAWTKTLDS